MMMAMVMRMVITMVMRVTMLMVCQPCIRVLVRSWCWLGKYIVIILPLLRWRCHPWVESPWCPDKKNWCYISSNYKTKFWSIGKLSFAKLNLESSSHGTNTLRPLVFCKPRNHLLKAGKNWWRHRWIPHIGHKLFRVVLIQLIVLRSLKGQN